MTAPKVKKATASKVNSKGGCACTAGDDNPY